MTRISQKNSGENHATSTIDMNGIFYSAPEMALSAVPVGFLKKRRAFKKQGTGGGGFKMSFICHKNHQEQLH